MKKSLRLTLLTVLFLSIGLGNSIKGAPTVAAQSAGPLVISEFMASNGGSFLDEDGDSSDWIEVHNSSANTVSLQGYYLTDNSAEMNKWAFPDMTIGAGERLLVFASNKDSAIAGSELHTNFKLSASGEYLALSDGGTAIASEYTPAFPQQYKDVSFGIDGSGDQVYFSASSPGDNNGDGIFPYVAAPPTASVKRGFYSAPQTVTLAAEAGATIRYTTDGSEPTASSGTVYAGPLTINQTTMLRAVAVLAGSNPSTVETFSYIFLNDVISQATPAGWPTDSVNGQLLDFGMDPDVVAGQEAAVKQSLQSLPSVSIVTNSGNLFDPTTGIFVNAQQRGSEWERPASVEWLNADNSGGFQIDAGLRIRGGHSRIGSNAKHAFRFFFDGDYDGALDYPIFGEEGVDTFKKLDLRTAQNYSWAYEGTERSTYLREVWSRDTQAAMGNPYTRSNYLHLYVNGHYWGLFMTQERVSEEYAEDYFDGKEDDYDVIKHYRNTPDEPWEWAGAYYVSAGNDQEWLALWPLVQDQTITDAEYRQIAEMVEIDNLIDYKLIHIYSGDWDAGISAFRQDKRSNNWYAVRDRTGDGTKWRFFAHDAEHSLGALHRDVNANRVGPFPVLGDNEYYKPEYFNPQWLHQALTSNEQYREKFRYRAWQHLVAAGGALTPAETRARWDNRKAEVAPAILAESARWGDAKRANDPFGVSQWQTEVNWVESNWFPARTDIVLAQLRAQNLAPTSQPSPPTAPEAKMVLNEYNAVDSEEVLQENGSDSTFGQVLGNGGDWFELVTVVDNLDIRGWTLEIWEADNFAKIPRRTDVFEFADQALLSNLRRGTIVTVAEDVADDPSYDPAGGDWVINLQANKDDEGTYFTPETQSNFDTNSKNWQMIIRDAAGNVVFGPAGEGVGTLASGVGNKEVGKLEADPSALISASSAYNDGVSSTFGGPNTWSDGTVTQDFSALRSDDPAPQPPAQVEEIARGKAVTVSSQEASWLSGQSAIDGNGGTRWSSQYSDNEWIQIDFGKSYDITRVLLNWETAYGKGYEIQISNNGTSWTTIYSTSNGDGGVDSLAELSGSGRYIRMQGTERGTQWGYSIWELEVYGVESAAPPVSEPPAPVPPAPAPPAAPDALQNEGSGKCIDRPGNQGVSIIQWECTGGENQRLKSVPAGGGAMLQFANSDLCLDVSGTRVLAWTCHGGDNQIFNWDGAQVRVKSTGHCLTIADGLTENGTAVVMANCTNSPAQRFSTGQAAPEPLPTATPAPAPPAPEVTKYLLQNVGSGQCLDIAGASLGNSPNALQWPCHGQPNQQLEEVPGNGGFMLKIAHSDKCLDVWAGNIYQWTCHGGDNQIFNWDGAQLQIKVSGQCMAVQNGSSNNGANIQPENCSNSASQQFKKVGVQGASININAELSVDVNAAENTDSPQIFLPTLFGLQVSE